MPSTCWLQKQATALPVRDTVFRGRSVSLTYRPFFPTCDSWAHSCLGPLPLGSIWQGPQTLCLPWGHCLSPPPEDPACALSPRPPRLPRPQVPPPSLSLHLVLDFPASARDPQKSSLVGAAWRVSRLARAGHHGQRTEWTGSAPQRLRSVAWTLGVTPVLLVTELMACLPHAE